MSVLRSLESKIAGLVEGAFSRAFRSQVQPVEIARKLVREMEQHKVVSLSRTYVPNEYTVWLSPDDRRQFADYEDELGRELTGYLLESARRDRLALLTRPEIRFETDDRLGLGEFGIQARLVRPGDGPDGRPRQGNVGHTMVYTASERLSTHLADPLEPRRGQALLRFEDRRVAVPPGGAVLGRSRECDVVLDDPNVSRRHAEVRPSGGSWVIADLGSTNGVKVNGRRLTAPQSLKDGDEVLLGTVRAVFGVE